jgi:hypothetical protein
MNDLIFDASWWMLALVIAAGIAVWWQGNMRQDRALKRMGLVVFAAGLAWTSIAWAVDTDKEAAIRRTSGIVSAVHRKDWEALRSLLDAQTSFPPVYANRDALVEGARLTVDAIGLKSVRVLGMNVEQKQSVILVDFRALSDQERTGGQQTITDWRFDFQNRGGGFRLYTITPLKSDAVGPEQIIGQLRRAP